ncbi:MAG TPA: wax ester/triacylglycerol synthase family O-acyltransferase [Mycobacteriales bacterium]|nr:wax ester/triacylglycerol synthase family O-acyltransferase [Mycobacteriales bacterium]
MHELSGTDAGFLYFETPSSHMHVLGTVVVDTRDCPDWGTETLLEHLRERAPLAPMLTRKLVFGTLRLHHPVWADLHDFDPAEQVRRVECPSPGGMRELAALTASFAEEQLDRSRPMWEALVVEGMADHKAAMVFKIHHSATDGVGAARLMGAIMDLTPKGRTPEELRQARDFLDAAKLPEPGVLAVARHTATGLALWPVKLLQVVPTATKAVAKVVSQQLGSTDTSGGALPLTAPRTPFNGRISPFRKVSYTDVSMADVKAIKNAVGGTVNDAVIAICGGALRAYLDKGDALPSSSLIASCPVSVRGDDASSGNAVSAMFTSLGTDIEDPLERLKAVRQANLVGKSTHKAMGDSLVSQVGELLPANITTGLARSYGALRLADFHPVVQNLVVSNVPGPPVDLFVAGARVCGLYPLGPVLEGAGLNITLVSVGDRLDIGLISCAERMPDLDDLAAEFAPAVQELLDAVS